MLITTRLIHLPKSQGYTHSLQLEKHSKGGKRSLSPPHQSRRVSSTVNRPGATVSGWHLRADWNLPGLCSCFLVWLVVFVWAGVVCTGFVGFWHYNMQDFSAPARAGTRAPCSGSAQCYPLDCQEVPGSHFCHQVPAFAHSFTQPVIMRISNKPGPVPGTGVLQRTRMMK